MEEIILGVQEMAVSRIRDDNNKITLTFSISKAHALAQSRLRYIVDISNQEASKIHTVISLLDRFVSA